MKKKVNNTLQGLARSLWKRQYTNPPTTGDSIYIPDYMVYLTWYNSAWYHDEEMDSTTTDDLNRGAVDRH